MDGIAHSLRIILGIIENMVMVLVLASIICSWVNADPSNQLVQMVYRSTEPLYRPFRKLTSRLNATGIDFAPMLFLLTAIFVFRLLDFYLRKIESTGSAF